MVAGPNAPGAGDEGDALEAAATGAGETAVLGLGEQPDTVDSHSATHAPPTTRRLLEDFIAVSMREDRRREPENHPRRARELV